MVSFSIFSLLTWYHFIISYSSIPSFKYLTAPLHLPLSSPYKVHSNNTCFSVSTSPHRHLSSSYFHVILSLPLTGKHPPLTISLTPAPTFPSAKLSFIGHSFICTYSFSLSVSLNPFFHTCLPTSLILLQICFFQNSKFTFIPNFTIPFKLTSLNQIRFTNSKSPNLLHICLHRDHHLDLHPNSIKHALPISDTRFSSNTTFNIHFTIDFSSLSSKVLHPVSPLISSFPTSQSHRPIPFWRISKCCCCLPTPMALASGGGSPMFPLVVHQPASPSIWPAVQSLRRGLSTNPGATMWCVCGCS